MQSAPALIPELVDANMPTPRLPHLPRVDAARGSLPRAEELTPQARAAVAAGKTLYADSIESLVRHCCAAVQSHCTLHRPAWLLDF